MMETLEARAPSLKERQRREREELILDEAERLLGERGYGHLVMEELAERVGIGKGTIYLHFPSKEDLVRAIVERGAARMIHHLEAIAAERERPAWDRARAIIFDLLEGKNQWIRFLSDRDRREVIESVRHQATFREQRARLSAVLAGVIEEGKANGEFDPLVATPVAALALFSLLRMQESDIVLDDLQLDRRAVVDALLRLVFQGLRARPEEKEVGR